MAEFFEDPEWKRKQNNTLMQQMLSGQISPSDAAARQWADALGMMTPGGGFLQEISRKEAMKGLVKGLANYGIIKGPSKDIAAIRATKSLLRDIRRSPQKELDRIDEVTTEWPEQIGDIAFVEYGTKTVPIKSPSGSIMGTKEVPHTKLAFNPGEIESAAKRGSWWHELAHPRTRGIGPAEGSPELELAEIAHKMSRKMPYWQRPSEQISVMMQLLMRDPEIMNKTLVKGAVDPNKYDIMYNAALRRALTQNIRSEDMYQKVFGKKVPVTSGPNKTHKVTVTWNPSNYVP